MENHFRRGEGPDAPVSDLTIDDNNNIPEWTREEWHKFMLAVRGCPKDKCGVDIGRY